MTTLQTDTMQAAVLTAVGDDNTISLETVSRPAPLPTEVLVRVRAAGVNPVDWKTRRGQGMAGVLGEPPYILGWDVSGVVEAVGYGVTRFAPGDEVYGMPWFPREAGAYAEYVTAPSRHLAPKPRSLDHAHAAAAPLAALTAWQALVDTAALQPGQRVLIHAGAGGVGHLAVQIAHHLRAHVITTASPANHEWLRSLGADEIIDYTAAPFETQVSGVDVVLDLAGESVAHTSSRSLATLMPGGLLICPNGATPEIIEAASAGGHRVTSLLVEPSGEALDQLSALIDAGTISVELATTFPLSQVEAAHELSATGHTRGKISLTI